MIVVCGAHVLGGDKSFMYSTKYSIFSETTITNKLKNLIAGGVAEVFKGLLIDNSQDGNCVTNLCRYCDSRSL
jgi:hypothetical protein